MIDLAGEEEWCKELCNVVSGGTQSAISLVCAGKIRGGASCENRECSGVLDAQESLWRSTYHAE